MARQIRMWLVVLIAAVLVAPLHADGMFLGRDLNAASKPSSAAQKAVLIREGDDEVLLLQTTYQGPADRFAWVIPVPSKPSETFAAEPAFITETFKGTEPVVVTELGKPKRSRYTTAGAPGGMAPPPPPGAAGGVPPPVQVLEEKEVGDYHAVVLAATQGGELQKWLQKNGYHLPAEAQGVLSDYVRRGWVFVALKMQEQRAREQPVLTEVAPLGLRFRRPAEGLVYPLTISRVSAPPLSALLLCVIADQPYTCRTIPTVWLTEKVKLKRDQTYGDLRRQMTRNPTRLLCEFSGEAPFHYLDLSYRAKDWERGRTGDFYTRQASRFFALLAPEEMVDLTFAPDAGAPQPSYRVLVRREGPEIAPRAMMMLTRAIVLMPGTEEQQAAMHEPLTPPESKPPRRPLGDGWRVPLAVLIIFGAVIAWIIRRYPMSPTATLLGSLLALGLMAGVARSGGMMPGLSVLSTIQAAVDMFQEDTGCLPATVADLAARQQPATGLDPSGNQVPVKGWRGPYLMYIPPDPVRGGRLVMDPLNAFALDTTGLKTTCEPVTYDEGQAAAGKSGHELKAYWKETPAQVAREMEPYRQWLQARQQHHLFAFETGVNSGSADAVTALVVDRDDLTYFTLHGKQCWVGVNGQLLTLHVAREEEVFTGMPGAGERFCGVTDATDAFRLLPRLSGMVGVRALGPEGMTLASGPDGLTILKPDGGKRDYAWNEERIWRASFSRDGKTAYIQAGPSPHSTTISRLDLATGQVTKAVSGVDEELCVAGPDGVLYMQGLSLWRVAGGTLRLLARDLPEKPVALALARDYAYWAISGHADLESNTIYRVSLRDGRVKPIAHFGEGTLIMAADGTDLYTAHRSDDSVDRLTLLADGKKPLRLGSRPELAAPPDLPRVD